jgi:hypothetical protein
MNELASLTKPWGRMSLVVVDFGSAQCNVTKILEAAQIPYKLIVSNEKFSRTKGLNTGCGSTSEAHGICFMLDVDLDLPTDFHLTIRQQTIESLTAYAPVMYSFNKDKPMQVGEGNGWWRTTSLGMIGVFKTDFQKIGGYDEKQFTTKWGGEDLDLASRLMKSGLEIIRPLEKNYFHKYHPNNPWHTH